MGGSAGARRWTSLIVAALVLGAPTAASGSGGAGAPGQPDWPDGPPPGSVFEPGLAGDGPGGATAEGGLSPQGEVAAVRNQVPTSRLAGANRYETATAVSRRVFPDGADTVYLAQADLLVDAQSAGALTDGPVLLVPPCDRMPSVVTAEIERLDPSTVVALGGPVSICDDTLTRAAGGRATDRIEGDDRYETAARIGQWAFPDGAGTVYLANGEGDWSADALVGGTLTDGPVLLAGRAKLPEATRQAIAELAPTRVVALGGDLAISEATLAAAAGGRSTSRLAGANRYETAAAIARHAFAGAERTAYLARGDQPADAVVGGTLTDGPILLAPPDCRVLPEPTWRHVSTSTPDRVVALGGTVALCSEQLSTAARMSTFTALERVRDTHLLDLLTKTRAVSPLRHVPGDLVAFRGGQHQLRSEVSQQLDALFRAAADAGHPQLHLTSGFRSYETQQATYDYWVRTLGQKEADRISARPGHSEHQLGQAADIWGRDCAGRECFGSTPEGRWVAANAHRWGFIVRYPAGGEGVTGYAYEPWHLRYVGPRAAWMMTVRDQVYWDHYRARAVQDSRGL